MRRLVVVVAAAFAVLSGFAGPAAALDPLAVPLDDQTLDLTPALDLYQEEGAQLFVQTAPDALGVVRRVQVSSVNAGTPVSYWAVFALVNNGDTQIDRLLVAPHFRLTGSGLIWPDLGGSRIVAVNSMSGLEPERQLSQEADVFRITLDPGSVATFAVELRTPQLPALQLWEADNYKDAVNSYTLFRGIVLGISGLLALLLTIVFVVKGTALFPAAAGLAWAVLAYLCVEFGFWNRVTQIQPGDDQIWRAVAEVLLSAALVIFTYTYLHLGRWHVRYSHLTIAWLVGLMIVLGIAVIEPSIGAGIARLSFGATVLAGAAVIVWLATRRFDRAVMLIPTWILLIVWVGSAGLSVLGVIDGDIIQPALAAGLVLIVLLIGFTVMQHAFAGGSVVQGPIDDTERRALALIGAGDIIWDWDVERDRIQVGPEADELLGLEKGSLSAPSLDWIEFMHPGDRDRFKAMLDAIVEVRRGRINLEFRIRAEDGHYRWFLLRARPVLGADREVLRCVGTLFDITEERVAEERLLHDSVRDNLTGLPNRQLFIDRLGAALTRSSTEGATRPSVLVVDLDGFKQINDTLGMSVGDSILLTISRRLTRLIKAQDTLARLAGDQFGLILLSESQAEQIAAFAESVRRAIRSPIAFGEKEILPTASIGLALPDDKQKKPLDAAELVKDAEIGMYHAKRHGGDRIEAFRPALRQVGADMSSMEADLKRALGREEIKILYQPVVRLFDRSIAGFEALVRWDHPKHGRIPPSDFVPLAERSGLISQLGLFVLERATKQLSDWQHEARINFPLFVSVNISSRELLRHDLITDVKSVLVRANIDRGSLKLELTESIVMENPEHSSQVLNRIRELGAGLSLDDFGTGYSSLAYLQRFPFDTLKIDKSFVRGQAGGAREVILRSIVNLAHDLDMDVVAEGAEAEDEVAELVDLGCEYAQGYIFGAPMAATDASKLLLREKSLAIPA
ncbi:MAG: EAL domain-containing protein [Bauldia sp.]